VESYATEEQQVEAIKKWFKENGASILFTIAIVLSLVFGWQAWTRSQEDTQQTASVLYQDMIEALVLAKNPTETEKQSSTVHHLGEQLIEEYSDLQYAHFAALAIAKLEVEKGNFPAAVDRLKWVLDQKADKP